MFDKKVQEEIRAYRAWAHMKSRCCCKTDKDYPNYGGRGVSVYPAWLEFGSFFEYVSKLENYGREGYSLNRINNDGNYEPGNVEWADYKAQQNNKRNNRLISYSGKTQTLSQWSKELGLDYKVVWMRLYRLNWSPEEAFTTDIYPMYHNKEGC